MRILEHRIYFFLSLLAGKFSAFEQMLLTEPIFLKKAHAYLNSPWLKFFLQSDTKANQLSAILVKPVAVLSWVRCAKSVWYH